MKQTSQYDELQPGLTFIGDRTKQFRYVDDEGVEHWEQQCPEYKCAVPIKRGQPVSIYTLQLMRQDLVTVKLQNQQDMALQMQENRDEVTEAYRTKDLTEEQLNALIADDDAYVIPTDIRKHDKVVGIALEYGNIGDIIHIQTTGTFKYHLPGSKWAGQDINPDFEEKEYYPNFTFKDAVGFPVFVRATDDKGNPTVGEIAYEANETFTAFDTVIHLGYITDAPVEGTDQSEIWVELQLNGDVRGPIDHTQEWAPFGEPALIPSENQIKVYALGEEDNEKFQFKINFHHIFRNVSNNENVFLALQRMDGNTVFIIPRGSNFKPENFQDLEDVAFYRVAELYSRLYLNKECDIIYYDADVDAIEDKVKNVQDALNEAFGKITTTYKYAYADEKIYEAKPSKLIFSECIITKDTASFIATADDYGGYYCLYVSSKFKEGLFMGSDNIKNGAVYNRGRAVLADNRIGKRRNILGVYFSHHYNQQYNCLEYALFMNKGLFIVQENVDQYHPYLPQEGGSYLEPGTKYYLGQHGNLTTMPGNFYDSVIEIGTARTTKRLLVDIETGHLNNGDMPVGYIKPSACNNAEYGFLLMDGKTKYEKEKYEELLIRLRGWYAEEDLTPPDGDPNCFIIPAMIMPNNDKIQDRNYYCEIKYLATGIYKEIPYEPFKRKFGTFPTLEELRVKVDSKNLIWKNDRIEIDDWIPDIDVTDLVTYGPAEENIRPADLEQFDIKLYVDFNKNKLQGPYDWVEVPMGIFNYNNAASYGFRWEFIKDQTTFAPYDRYLLHMNCAGGKGPALVTKGNQPPRELWGCPYKVWICRKEYRARQFDIDNLLRTRFAPYNVVLDNETNPVTGHAVIEYIGDHVDTKELHVHPNDETALDVDKNGINIKGVTTFYGPDGASFKVDDGVPHNYLDFDNDGTYYNKNRAIRNSLMYIENAEFRLPENWTEDNARPSTIVPYMWLKNHENQKMTKDQNTTVHGIVNGTDGNINASALQGVHIETLKGDKYVNGAKDKISIPYVNARRELVYPVNGIKSFKVHKTLNEYQEDIGGILGKNEIVEEVSSENDTAIYKLKIGNAAIKLESEPYKYKKHQIAGSSTEESSDDVFEEQRYLENQITTLTVLAGDGFGTVKAKAFNVASRILYKKLTAENIREFTDFTNADLLEQHGQVAYTFEDKRVNLGSAMQAIYELPLALYHYNNEPDDYKNYLGIIVERIHQVKSDPIDVSRYIFDKNLGDLRSIESSLETRQEIDPVTGEVTNYNVIPETGELIQVGRPGEYNYNRFKYTPQEVESIHNYLDLITDNTEDTFQMMSAVGLLLKATKETQERLLQLEESTFGGDAPTIPGKVRNFTGLAEDITPNPTVLGLNRLVRALCRETFYDANPYQLQIIKRSGDTGQTLSRVDRVDAQINGHAAIDHDKGITEPREHLLKEEYGIGYPHRDKPVLIPEKNPNDDDFDWHTGNEDEDVTIPNYYGKEHGGDNFDGLNDAVNRIVKKLDALTVVVYGRNNVNANPVRLDTIRDNITAIIKETYFKDYKDYVKPDGTNDFWDRERNKISRIDELTDELYKYALRGLGEADKKYLSKIPSNKYNGTPIVPTTPEFVEAKVPQVDCDEYHTRASIVDVILDMIGTDSIIRRKFQDVIDEDNRVTDPNRLLKTEFDEFRGHDVAFDTRVKDARDRINDTILNRLFSMEIVLDKVVYKLSMNDKMEDSKPRFQDDAASNLKTDLHHPSKWTYRSVEHFLALLSEWSGISYDGENWYYLDRDNKKQIFDYTVTGWERPEIQKGQTVCSGNRIKEDVTSTITARVQRIEEEMLRVTTENQAMKKALDHYYTMAKKNTEDANDDGHFKDYNVYNDVIDLLKTVYGHNEGKDEPASNKYEHRKDDPNGFNGRNFTTGGQGAVNAVEELYKDLYTVPQTVEENAHDSERHFDLDSPREVRDTYLRQERRKAQRDHGLVSPLEDYNARKDTNYHEDRSFANRFDVLEDAVQVLRTIVGSAYFNNNKWNGILDFSKDTVDDFGTINGTDFGRGMENDKFVNRTKQNNTVLGLIADIRAALRSVQYMNDDEIGYMNFYNNVNTQTYDYKD